MPPTIRELMKRFAWAAVIVLLALAGWYLSRRHDSMLVKLPDGRTLKLLSTIAMFDGPGCRMLSFEYISDLPADDRKQVQSEAGAFLQAAAGDKRFDPCTTATVTARRRGESDQPFPPHELGFGFERRGPRDRWYAVQSPE